MSDEGWELQMVWTKGEFGNIYYRGVLDSESLENYRGSIGVRGRLAVIGGMELAVGWELLGI